MPNWDQMDWGEVDSWGRAIAVAEQLGLESMRFEYSGMGDSGDMEDWSLTPEIEAPDGFMEAVTHLAWSVTPPGFENNDGGQGSIEVDVSGQTVTLEHTDNEEQREEGDPFNQEAYRWGPHDMVIAPRYGVPYPWRAQIDWNQPLSEQYGNYGPVYAFMKALGRRGAAPAAALARFLRVFDPVGGLRLFYHGVYEPPPDLDVSDDVKEAFIDAWDRPPLVPRPLPAPDDETGWILLVLRVTGGIQFSVEVMEGDIWTYVTSPEKSGLLLNLPGINDLGAALVERHDLDINTTITVAVNEDDFAACDVYQRELWYEMYTTDPDVTEIYSGS